MPLANKPVSKCYPAIFYPPLIIKFLANKPAPSFSNYQQSPKKGRIFEKQSALPGKTPRFLGRKALFQWAGLFAIGIIISLSFAVLSPPWLVAVAWIAIAIGVFCMVKLSKRTHNNNKTVSPPMLTTKTKVKSDKLLRLPTAVRSARSPQREAQLRRQIEGKVLQPMGKSTATQGVSEQAFYRVLAQVFPKVVQGVEFQNTEFPYLYSADFVLVHESGLCIDIEVDEPYVGNTKAPHHCIDQGKDEIRNKFFTNGNWIVIRFSERQAVKYPQSCCMVIAEVVANISGDFTYLTQLQSVPTLPIDPMWTIKQAKKWAIADYRQTYLPSYQRN